MSLLEEKQNKQYLVEFQFQVHTGFSLLQAVAMKNTFEIKADPVGVNFAANIINANAAIAIVDALIDEQSVLDYDEAVDPNWSV